MSIPEVDSGKVHPRDAEKEAKQDEDSGDAVEMTELQPDDSPCGSEEEIALTTGDTTGDTTASIDKHQELSLFMRVITAIPICGGFCAHTDNPEKTFLRNYSNETTPPQPCLYRYTCRQFWEHSCFFRGIGRIGFEWGDKNRARIMLTAFVGSFLAWILCFAAVAAVSHNSSDIQNTAWARWKISIPASVTQTGVNYIIFSYVGLKARVDVKKSTGGIEISRTTVKWTQRNACNLEGFYYSKCSRCGKSALGAVQWMVTGLITQIFQMTTDLQRTTRYGDLNCQKTLGMLSGMYGSFSTFRAIRDFMWDCNHRDPEEYGISYDSRISLKTNHTPTGQPFQARVDLRAGPGCILLVIATILKVFDVLCHAIVPVPNEKSEPAEEDLTLHGYMMRNSEPCNFGVIVEEGQSCTLVSPSGLSESHIKNCPMPASKRSLVEPEAANTNSATG